MVSGNGHGPDSGLAEGPSDSAGFFQERRLYAFGLGQKGGNQLYKAAEAVLIASDNPVFRLWQLGSFPKHLLGHMVIAAATGPMLPENRPKGAIGAIFDLIYSPDLLTRMMVARMSLEHSVDAGITGKITEILHGITFGLFRGGRRRINREMMQQEREDDGDSQL